MLIINLCSLLTYEIHQRWHHCLQLNWLDLDYMECTNWCYFKYLKTSQDLTKYIEEYALRIGNTTYLYSASTPICQSSPQRPVLQICNITSNRFALKYSAVHNSGATLQNCPFCKFQVKEV